METILIQSIIELQVKGLKPSIILMNKRSFKKLFKEINSIYPLGNYKELKCRKKHYMGINIYLTKDLKEGVVIVK